MAVRERVLFLSWCVCVRTCMCACVCMSCVRVCLCFLGHLSAVLGFNSQHYCDDPDNNKDYDEDEDEYK